MKGGITKRLEETITALGKGELKNALSLTDRPELEKYHSWIEGAAREALSDKENTKKYLAEAGDRIQATLTNPLDDTSLEGVEEMLKNTAPGPELLQQGKTDEELFEECEECHVAVAAARIAEVCAEHPEEAGSACKLISQKLEDENTTETDWIKAMVETAEQAQGEAKEQMVAAVSELTSYLERRNSPFLKELDTTQP